LREGFDATTKTKKRKTSHQLNEKGQGEGALSRTEYKREGFLRRIQFARGGEKKERRVLHVYGGKGALERSTLHEGERNNQ